MKMLVEIPEEWLKTLRVCEENNNLDGLGRSDKIILAGNAYEKPEEKPMERKMTLTEIMNERYKNREDKDNVFGVGVSDSEFRKFIIDYLLGENWYVADSLGQSQINEIALYDVLKEYSKRYRKECKKQKARNKK